MTGIEVRQIIVRHGKVIGVDTDQGFHEADQVVANGDVLSVNRLLLAPEHRKQMSDGRIRKYEPSISGYVTLAGVRKQYDSLLHHTVFSRIGMNRSSNIFSVNAGCRWIRPSISVIPVIRRQVWLRQERVICLYW